MAFDPRDIEEIKSRLKPSDVIGSYMQLIKKGAGEWVQKGNESFTVNDTKKIWCEFGDGGDGKGHDVIEYLTTYEGLEFVDAVKELAQVAGVTLQDAKPNGARWPAASPDRPANARGSGARSGAGSKERRQSAANDRADGSGEGADQGAANASRATAAQGKREVVKAWDYLDPENNLLYQVVRMQERLPDGSWRMKDGKPWKTFIQRRPSPDNDGTWILGLDVVDREEPHTPHEFVKTEKGDWWIRATEDRLKWKNITVKTFAEAGNIDHWLFNANAVIDELQEPKEDQRPIFLPEGEAKVDVLTEWGLLAVTNSSGAKHFTQACAEFFRNARQVVILQDNDRAGAERVSKLAPMLKAVGVEQVQALNFRDVWAKCPPKGDVKDWRDNGGTKEELLDIVDNLPDWKPEPYKSKFGAKTMFDLGAPVRAYPWRIKGILPMYDNTLLMGPSRSGKTFECLDMLMHMHSGEPFAGRKVVPCGSVYLTYEGATGFENRLRAYLQHYGMTVADLHSFAWITRPPNLFASEDNAKALAEEIVQISQGFQLPLGTVVIDTHNAASRGSSEIKSEDINRILDNYQTLKDHTGGVPLIIIGHTNAEGKHRGNEQFFNNIETAILIERVLADPKTKAEKRDDNGRVLRRGVIQKQREGDDRTRWEFVLESVQIGVDEDGDPITSMVSVEPAQHVPGEVLDEHDTSKPKPEGFYLKGHDVGIFRALLKVIDHLGAPPPAHLGIAAGIAKVVKWSELVAEYRKGVPMEEGEDNAKYRNRVKARTRRFAESLANYNVIGILQEPGTDVHYVWPTGRRVYGKGLAWPPLPPKKKEQKPLLAPGENPDDKMPF